MATKPVTDESFQADVLESDRPVLVDFYAQWCAPCKVIAPSLEEISEELGDAVTILKLDADESPEAPTKYGVRGFPTLMLFKGGEPVNAKLGGGTKRELKEWIEAGL